MDENLYIPMIYKIIIQGHLKGEWAEWLNGMVIEIGKEDDGPNNTIITVRVPDQSALRGTLNKLWDLNLTVISINSQDYTFTKGDRHENQIYPSLG